MRIQGRVTRDGRMLFGCLLSSRSLNISSLVVFELDTGAASTCLFDSDARRLGLDYSVLPQIEPAYGIGGKCNAHAIEDAVLRFVSGYGEWSLERQIRLTVLNHKVEEIQDADVRSAILACPSLLGRDILGSNFTITRQEVHVTLDI